MAQYVIPRSYRGLQIQVIGSGIVAFLLCLLVSLLMSFVIHVSHRLYMMIMFILWPSVFLLWGIGAGLLLYKWDSQAYTLKEDSLVIRNKTMYGVKQELYRYDAILSVAVKQSFLGVHYGYGTVQIFMPKADHPVELNNVIDPENQGAAIKRALISKSPNTQALIS